MKDRRTHQRVSLRTEIWIGQDGIFTNVNRMIRDMGNGGAFIETPELFSIGTVLSIRLRLPDTRDLLSCAVSVRHLGEGAGLGVQFLDLSQEDRQLVGAFVKQNAQG
ncbi:MAG: PilZ domain-containing protein [Acidobacteria bacterium]|nr:PilZ domain-containing protein [Acidobacteriota bacterium]